MKALRDVATSLFFLMPLGGLLIVAAFTQGWAAVVGMCGAASIAVVCTHWEAARLRAYDEQVILRYEQDLDTYDRLTEALATAHADELQGLIEALAAHCEQSRESMGAASPRNTPTTTSSDR